MTGFPCPVLVINLPDRTDRRERIEALFAREGVPFQFSPGVRFQPGEVLAADYDEVNWENKKDLDPARYLLGMAGANRAHLNCLKAARDLGVEKVLVFEDDVEFRPGWQTAFQRVLGELPADWSQLYLSSAPFNPVSPVSPRFRRLNGAWQATAVCYSASGLEKAIACLEKARCEIDHCFSLYLHPLGGSYEVYPNVTSQTPGFSDFRGVWRGRLP
jgi:GR25 family glycosyltransferase involved in LPS biosynthesis